MVVTEKLQGTTIDAIHDALGAWRDDPSLQL
jgi:hypothetical protein